MATQSINIFHILIFVSIIVGVVECFWGYRFFRPIISIYGFIGGFLLVYWLVYNNLQNIPLSVTIGLIIGGIMGLIVVNLLYKVIFFVWGAMLGGFLGYIAYNVLTISIEPYILPIIFGLCLALIAVKYTKGIIILTTAFTGAEIIVQSIFFLSNNYKNIFEKQNFFFYISQYLIFTIIISITGVLYQYKDKINWEKIKSRIPISKENIKNKI